MTKVYASFGVRRDFHFLLTELTNPPARGSFRFPCVPALSSPWSPPLSRSQVPPLSARVFLLAKRAM